MFSYRYENPSIQPFLDVRVAGLDGTLENSFRKLYPNFRRPMIPVWTAPQWATGDTGAGPCWIAWSIWSNASMFFIR